MGIRSKLAGGKRETSSGLKRPLSTKPILSLCLCNCAHFYNICSLFSYAGILAADLGWAADRDSAGKMAGFLQSANVLGRLPTSVVWGFFADRFGLKLGMALAMISLASGSLLFGFCTGAAIAISVRFVLIGMGNGFLTFLGPISMELGGAERQAEITGLVFGFGKIAQLMGPAIGGWTYGVIESSPAMVPGLVGCFIAIFALGTLIFWLPNFRPEGERRARKAAKAARNASYSANPSTSSSSINACSSNSVSNSSIGTSASANANASTTNEEYESEVTSSEEEGGHGKPKGFFQVICAWPVPLLVLLRSTQGFLTFAFFEVVPLWAISSKDVGGLALGQEVLGTIFACSAVIAGVFMSVGIKLCTQRFGLRMSAAWGNIICVGLYVLLPFLTNAWFLLVLHGAINSACGLVGVSYIASINAAVGKGDRAKVNGVCVTMESLGKGIGPASIAIAFAYSLQHWGYAGHGAVFFFMAFLHLLLFAGSLLLPQDIDSGVRKPTDEASPKKLPQQDEEEDDEDEEDEEEGRGRRGGGGGRAGVGAADVEAGLEKKGDRGATSSQSSATARGDTRAASAAVMKTGPAAAAAAPAADAKLQGLETSRGSSAAAAPTPETLGASALAPKIPDSLKGYSHDDVKLEGNVSNDDEEESSPLRR